VTEEKLAAPVAKKLAQMNYCFCGEPHLTRKPNSGRFSMANVSMAWRTKAGNHTAPWFLSLHSLSVRGFSFASYFISPSAHKQLFTEFEQGLVWIEEVRKFWNCNISFVFDNYCSIMD
jgi:hypothetical protein